MTGTWFTTSDGCRLAYELSGDGLPVLWQHGLGANRDQPAEVFPDLDGVLRITLECRGHGQSELGDPDRLTVAQFADDAVALLDHLDVSKAVVGGISLGAAIGLRLAALHQARVLGLVAARPSWVDEWGPAWLEPYIRVGELVAAGDPASGLKELEASSAFKEVEAFSPDNAASLRWFFERERPDTTVALLTTIPRQGPGLTRAQIASIEGRTLVMACDNDYVHKLSTARTLADLIPSADFVEITSKSIDRAGYVSDLRENLARFLEQWRIA